MRIVGLIIAIGTLFLLFQCQSTEKEAISFNEDIRPILNNHCLSCHGGVKKQGGYSLLFQEEAYDTTATGVFGIVPGKPNESELYLRLIHEDPTMRMPYESEPLPKEDIALIKKWIEQGASWETHWAFIPPAPYLTPPQTEQDWSDHPIDQFAWQKLKEKGFSPSPTADRATIIRRVYLDLIGIPPTLEEAQAFIADDSPAAYNNVVDQLLASPHFGEHWTSLWLDLARFGDSQGYQKDRIRKHIWRYRDWVIDALNKDLPFDQFTTDQLAGDLIPNHTEDQLLATAFHRNTNTNDEGGTDDEEFRIVAVMDRLNTTYEVWQGLTMSCVQCHSHPYDPILHKEFYESMAFFNNTQDRDLSNEQPRISLLSPGQKHHKNVLQNRMDQLRVAGDTTSDIFKTQVAAFAAIQPGPVPVMQELPYEESRTTPLFIRGNWLNHGDPVSPSTPSTLNAWPEDLPKNRLGFAQWLTHDQNPLTARVISNRIWAQIFGRGIVATVEDFGTQGDKPTHPELLDWLAIQFQFEHQWSLKALLKLIVTSQVYQQSSMADASLIEADPYNEWLTRGPRFRLSSEQIRDQALAVTDLLSPKMYGPSVMPYQPEGVWNIIRHVAKWETSDGEDQYRRGVYTFIRKTSPYPSRLTFDGTSRETCVSRRIRTNTPLQAMITMNDPVYLEAAQHLAAIMAKQHPNDLEAQLQFGYQKMLYKDIPQEKRQLLQSFYQQTKIDYEQHDDQITKLVPAAMPQTAEFAALVNTANLMLNLDEFLNKT